MAKKVYYIGFYAKEGETSRFSNIAAIRKMDYTMGVLAEAGYEVEVVSLAWILKPFSFSGPSSVQVAPRIRLHLPPAFFLKGIAALKVNIKLAKIWFLLYTLIRIPKNSVVIVYHSPKLYGVLSWLKKLKPIRIALEIGEIYGDVWDIPMNDAKEEKKLLSLCDYFIPVSKELFSQLAPRSNFMMHGTYRVQYPLREETENAPIIPILYAGSIDQTKAGAVTAVEIMKHLPNHYRMHIAGYGELAEVKRLEEEISKVNQLHGFESIKFHGKLDAKRLDQLMRECLIAVNPQNPGNYMRTAFPSKVMVYLTFQLNVVSTTIESVQQSEVADLITFVSGNEAIDFAKAIQSIGWNKIEQIPEVLNRLNEQCRENFIRLIEI